MMTKIGQSVSAELKGKKKKLSRKELTERMEAWAYRSQMEYIDRKGFGYYY